MTAHAAYRPKPDRSDGPDGWTVWHRDGVAVIMPTPDPDWPRALETVYLMRVEANLTGRCPACLSEDFAMIPVAPRQARQTLSHEAGCPVGDDGPLSAAMRP